MWQGICRQIPFYLKQHLKSCHVACYQELLKDEEKQKEKKEAEKLKALQASTGPTRSQKTLGQDLTKKAIKYQEITCKMAIFIGSCNVPNELAENDEFQSLVEVLDP